MCICLTVALGLPVRAQAPALPGPQAAVSALTVSGRVVRREGTTVPKTRVRLRHVDSGAIVAQTTSDPAGVFSFPVAAPGLYVVEAVNQDGGVLGVSNPISVTTIPVDADVTLAATRAAAFFPTSTWLTIGAVAAGAGVAAFAIGRGGVSQVQANAPVSPEQ